MTNNLQKAISALQELPRDAQDAIAVELLDEVSLFQHSGLSAAQQAVVDERLEQPLNIADQADVAAVFSKY